MATAAKMEVLRDDGGEQTVGQFTDPAFKKLSHINGEINKMTRHQLKERLELLRLDSKGVKEVLKKRLKNFYKKRVLKKVVQEPANNGIPDYDYYLVIDFEATCLEQNSPNFKHEIIEFPVVLVDAREKKVIDQFQSFVKPVVNPTLTEFCTALTGITQGQVDAAPEFREVLARVEEWKQSHRLGEPGREYAALTDGPWDMSRFMHIQCHLAGIEFPKWALKWVNLRKAYANFYDCKRMKLKDMLEHQGLPFEGKLHSGIDDSKNIAKIAMKMLEDGAKLRINERLTLCQGEGGLLIVEVRNVTCSQANNLRMRNVADENGEVENIEADNKEEADEREEADDNKEGGGVTEDVKNLTTAVGEMSVGGGGDAAADGGNNAEAAGKVAEADGKAAKDDGKGDWDVVKSKKEKKLEKKSWAEEMEENGEDDDDLLYYHMLQNNKQGKFEFNFAGK